MNCMFIRTEIGLHFPRLIKKNFGQKRKGWLCNVSEGIHVVIKDWLFYCHCGVFVFLNKTAKRSHIAKTSSGWSLHVERSEKIFYRSSTKASRAGSTRGHRFSWLSTLLSRVRWPLNLWPARRAFLTQTLFRSSMRNKLQNKQVNNNNNHTNMDITPLNVTPCVYKWLLCFLVQ